MSTFITHEELRTIVMTALVEEYGGTVADNIDRDLPLPNDSALMQAAVMTTDAINEYVTADECGKGDTALLQYADELAQQLFFGEE
jgi:hypothetical protein